MSQILIDPWWGHMPHGWHLHPCTRPSDAQPAPQGSASAPQGTSQRLRELLQRLRELLQCLREAGVTLNEKCEFSKISIKFLGHIIDAKGIHVDLDMVKAIRKFPAPTSITELQRFMGMVNQLVKFIPSLADSNTPLRHLLCKDTVGVGSATAFSFWTNQRAADLPTCLGTLWPQTSNCHCSWCLQHRHWGCPATDLRRCFISRPLSDAEKNYTVIEKEALAATWASERFCDCILGLDFTMETDHKPLVPLLSTVDLRKMPPHIQCFRLHLMRYNPRVVHVTGKNQITTDALLKAPVGDPDSADVDLVDNTTAFAKQTI